MKRLSIAILACLFLAVGCTPEDDTIGKEEAYAKCVSVCSDVLESDYTILFLCHEECKKEFWQDAPDPKINNSI